MRILKLSLLLLLLVPLLLTPKASAIAINTCSPEFRLIGALHIAWIDCQNNQDEVVIIVNGTNEDIDLTGYRLISQGGQEFLFQKTALNDNCCIIKAYDILRIHSGPKNDRPFDDPRDLHWLTKKGEPRIKNVWNDEGDRAELIDKEGKIIDVYQY